MADTTGTIVAPPVETDAASSPADVDTTLTDTAEVDQAAADETPADETPAPGEPEAEGEELADKPEDRAEELQEFKGNAAAAIRELCKAAPGLQQLLAKYPAVANKIGMLARRDAALRDQNVTVAELKEYRERLPNGLQDLNTIEQELGELGQIDEAFYGRRGADLIAHMHKADPEAAIALFREMPKEWARLDPQSYDEVFSSIMASTFARDRVAEYALRAYNRAKEAGDRETQEDAAALWNYFHKFGKKREEDSPEAQLLREERSRLDADRRKGEEADTQRFRQTYLDRAVPWQQKMVRENPVFKKLPASVSEAKKGRMVDAICTGIAKHLQKSRSFWSQFSDAYRARDLNRLMQVERGTQGWQPWIVNMYVRKVLAEETPGLIEGNRAANATKRAAAARTEIATRPAGKAPPAPARPGAKRAEDYTTRELINGIDRQGKQIPESVLDEWLQRSRG